MARLPEVAAYVERVGDGAWILSVRCPFCAARHQHGGGDGDAPALGARLAHCVDGGGGSYFLIAGSVDMPRPASRAVRVARAPR